MDRPGHHGGIIVQRPNDRMLFQERQRLLLRRLAREQLANRAQAKGSVRKGRFAGFFQRIRRVLLGQAEQPLQHASSFDAACGQHRAGPLVRPRADRTELVQEIPGPALQSADLARVQMLAQRAEAARLAPRMNRDLLEAMVEDAHQPRIPARPHRAPRYSGGTE